jgi:hypothetical protein
MLWRAAQDNVPASERRTKASRLLEALLETYGHPTPLLAPVLARLAGWAGLPATASYFQSLISVPHRLALAGNARFLLIANSSDWRPTDHRDASYILSEACRTLSFVMANSSLQEFARKARDHAESAGSMGSRALVLAIVAEAMLEEYRGSWTAAREKLESARQLAESGEPALLAEVLRHLAHIAKDRKAEIDDGRSLLEEAAALYRRVGSRSGAAVCKYDLATIATTERDFPLARSLNDEALEIARGDSNREQEMSFLFQRADIELHSRDSAKARRYAEEALQYQTGAGSAFDIAACLRLLADIELMDEDFPKARDSAAAALEIVQRLEHRRGEAACLYSLGEARYGLNEVAAAHQLLREALEAYREIDDEFLITMVEDRLDDLHSDEAQ